MEGGGVMVRGLARNVETVIDDVIDDVIVCSAACLDHVSDYNY